MIVNILNVDHGEAAVIQSAAGKVLVIGAGKNRQTGRGPIEWLRENRLRPDVWILNHLHEDHLDDLPGWDRDIQPRILMQHPEFRPEDAITQLTDIGMTPGDGLLAAARISSIYNQPAVGHGLDLQLFQYWHHKSRFPGNPNNLSLVTLVVDHGVGVLFSADLERDGWLAFTNEQPDFCKSLSAATAFMASHHGRINGYCPEIFEVCKPAVVIISDKELVHDTQDHDRYRAHVRGLRGLDGNPDRSVLTTRRDGDIVLHTGPGWGIGALGVETAVGGRYVGAHHE